MASFFASSNKPRFPDGVDVPVHRPRRDAHLPGQLVDGASDVAGEQFHQPKEFGYHGLVHNSS